MGKLLLFLNTPFLDAQQRRIIRQRITCHGHTVLWMCCPGYISPQGMSADLVSELTRLRLVEEGFGGRVSLAITDFEHPIKRDVPGVPVCRRLPPREWPLFNRAGAE